MKDYLEAYLQAALEQERIADEQFRDAVERRAREIAGQLERPYLEAMRLRELSRAYRKELTERIAAGERADQLLPLALQTISALCGDEAFARHNLSRMAAGADEAPQADDLAAIERAELSRRLEALTAFLQDGSVPEGERAQASLRLLEVEQRLAELGEGEGAARA